VFIKALYRTLERPSLFSAIATIGAVSLTQMPLRQALSSAFAAFVFAGALRRK